MWNTNTRKTNTLEAQGGLCENQNHAQNTIDLKESKYLLAHLNKSEVTRQDNMVAYCSSFISITIYLHYLLSYETYSTKEKL